MRFSRRRTFSLERHFYYRAPPLEGGGRSDGLRMQLFKPIQSTRERPRDALRLHSPTLHGGGRCFRTYFTTRFIARSCLLMQRTCHRHTYPMFKIAGRIRGALR